MATMGIPVRGGERADDSTWSGWPAPETLLLCLIAFLALIGTSVVGLLIGTAS